MTIDEAIDALTKAGLVVEKLGGLEQRILGGTARVNAEGDDTYRGAFSIGRAEAGWELVLSGSDGAPGSKSETRDTLEEVVRLTCDKLA